MLACVQVALQGFVIIEVGNFVFSLVDWLDFGKTTDDLPTWDVMYQAQRDTFIAGAWAVQCTRISLQTSMFFALRCPPTCRRSVLSDDAVVSHCYQAVLHQHLSHRLLCVHVPQIDVVS